MRQTLMQGEATPPPSADLAGEPGAPDDFVPEDLPTEPDETEAQGTDVVAAEVDARIGEPAR